MVETFFGTMQLELLDTKHWVTRQELANAIFEADRGQQVRGHRGVRGQDHRGQPDQHDQHDRQQGRTRRAEFDAAGWP
jgi:hypothetical protein